MYVECSDTLLLLYGDQRWSAFLFKKGDYEFRRLGAAWWALQPVHTSFIFVIKVKNSLHVLFTFHCSTRL